MGDFSAHFHRPESGIHTVEGNVAGSRAAALTKKRQVEQEAFEVKKRQIENDHKTACSSIHAKFQGDSSLSHAEQTFRAKTVGLVTAQDFKRAALESTTKSQNEEEATKPDTTQSKEDVEKQEKQAKKKKKKLLKEKKKLMSTLSFVNEDDDEALVLLEQDDAPPMGGGKTTNLKDPTVDTSFLPDKLREQQQQEERLKLEKKWKESQRIIKEEELEIIYSYWDGSGHRRSCTVKKGNTIGEFLEQVRKSLCKEFRELKSTCTDGLLYVKEDLMLPHDITFYDLIALKARGKSGPLFHFDVHEDVRIGAMDVRIEKDEAHPGKVVERQWFDRNKHIFPASRWEIYDPSKEYGGYTIHGKLVTETKK